jgi:hypothetical protein
MSLRNVDLAVLYRRTFVSIALSTPDPVQLVFIINKVRITENIVLTSLCVYQCATSFLFVKPSAYVHFFNNRLACWLVGLLTAERPAHRATETDVIKFIMTPIGKRFMEYEY